jgi:hypothetical protein
MLDPDSIRTLAKSLNREVWDLLAVAGRSAEQAQQMIHAAHASCRLWLDVGAGLNQQRGEWLIAHVYTVLGHAEPALRHAERCMLLTERHRDEMEDFDLAYAHEGLARAAALSGNRELAAANKRRSRELGDLIADAEDKQIFDGDYSGGDWHGVE